MDGQAAKRRPLITHAAVGCAGVLVGAVIASFHGQRSIVEQSPAAVSAAGETRPSSIDSAEWERSVRRVIREELARNGNLPTAAPAPLAAAPGSALVDLQSRIANAEAILVAATSRSVWTEEDADAFRAATAALPVEERQELVLKFAQAVNDRGMRLATGDTPF